MAQLALLAGRECAEHLRNAYARSILAVAVILTPLSVYGAVQNVAARQVDHAARAVQMEAARASPFRLTGNDGMLALRVLRPPATGGVVVGGDDTGTTAFWDPHPSGLRAGANYSETTSASAAVSTLDLEMLVRWLLGLVFAVLGAESISRTRQTGLLKTLLTNPVSPRRIVTGKLLGAAGSAAIMVTALSATASFSSVAFLTRPEAWDAVATSAAVAAPSWSYLMAMFAAGLIVGQVASTLQVATVSALVVWLVVAVLAVPALALLTQAVAPIPARSSFENDREAAYEEGVREIQRELGAILREWIGPDASTVDVEYEGELRRRFDAVWQPRIAALRARLNREDAGYAAAADRERRTAWNLSLTGPGTLLRWAAAALAGTGVSAGERWRAAVEAYQNELEAVLFDEPRPRLHLLVPQAAGGASVSYVDRRPGLSATELPSFQPPPDGLGVRIGDAVGALAGLVTYALVLALASVSLFRYRREGPSDRA